MFRNFSIAIIASAIVILGNASQSHAQRIGGFAGQVIDQANKELRNFDQARLNHMSRSPRPGRDYTKVYFQNKTRETLWLAVRFQPFEYSDGTTSELKFVDNDGPFDTKAWFKLKPNQRIHVANTANPHFYFFAETSSGSKWQGNNYKPVRSGKQTRKVGFRLKYVRGQYEAEQTITLK